MEYHIQQALSLYVVIRHRLFGWVPWILSIFFVTNIWLTKKNPVILHTCFDNFFERLCYSIFCQLSAGIGNLVYIYLFGGNFNMKSYVRFLFGQPNINIDKPGISFGRWQ